MNRGEVVDSAEQHRRDVARRALRAVFTGDMEQVELLYSAGVRLCHRSERRLQGLAGIRERALLFASSLWDCSVTFDYSVVSGDVVVTRWTVRGKTIGWLGGTELARRAVDGMTIARVSGEQVVEDWSDFTSPWLAGPELAAASST